MNDTELSRTKLKKADRDLRELGDALTGLSQEQLARMDLPQALLSAIEFYQQIRNLGARRRQWKTIGAVLRNMDTAPIRAALENILDGDRAQARRHHRIERWRDEMKAGNLALIDEVLSACPGADRQHLGQLVRNAIKEATAGTGVKASRALFRYLSDVDAQ
ncbi:MAG: ribosome biogenesis factor YjgA [Pseudomonadota bacterium]